MEIYFKGTLDRVNLKKAIALMNRPPFWLAALRIGLALLILGTIIWLASSFIAGEPLSANRVVRVFVQDLILGYFVVQPFIASNTMFKRLGSGDQEVMGRINPMGIYYNINGTDQVIEYPWDGFQHVFKTDNLIVLVTADSRISILPSYFFKEEQDWKHFCQYVDTRVKSVQ